MLSYLWCSKAILIQSRFMRFLDDKHENKSACKSITKRSSRHVEVDNAYLSKIFHFFHNK
ncbi:CLUMA_CG008388, isoform A [Clunio marinus]|uniref:CLUMA_CG008388, isoform A n=1 Tax=Clunio marinus TaxID=568069 RepID=A0A1J1I3L0_9DIPT|nr:CLUMA_CG008388, isoform A [Clunio marinus]